MCTLIKNKICHIDMINWLANKKINHEKVQLLLQECESTNKYTNYGPIVQRLESHIHDTFKIDDNKAIIATCSGTTALHALISGLNMYYDKELVFVISSYTFASANQGPLRNSIICDIDEDCGISLDKINEEYDGIIITNVHGNVCDIDKYVKYCDEHDKILLFDNAATAYTFYKGTNSCNFGVGSIISFHHTKPFGFGEGGCVIVDKKYEYYVRIATNFGIDNNLGEGAKYSNYCSNYKMSDISASYILSYLDNFDMIVERHREIYDIYKYNCPKDFILFPNYGDNPVCSSICLLYKHAYFDNTKLSFLTRKYYKPLHPTPNAINVYKSIVCIPCNSDMSTKVVYKIIDELNNFFHYNNYVVKFI